MSGVFLLLLNNINNLPLIDVKSGLEKLDKQAQKDNIVIDDLVLNRNIIINNTKALIIDGKIDSAAEKKFHIKY